MFEKLKELFSKKTKKPKSASESGLNLETVSVEGGNSSVVSQDFQIPTITSQTQGVSHEDQKALLKQRRKIPIYVLLLKFLSLLILTLTIILWIALYADLNEENSLLKMFGLSENTQTNYSKTKNKQKKLLSEGEKYSGQIIEYQRRLDEEDYFIYEAVMSDIKANHFRWFNETLEGEILIGIIDSVGLMKDYISQSSYENKMQYPISFILNNVTVDLKSFNRKEMNVGVKVSNVSQNTLTLSTEFTEMLNSFPFFKGAKMSSFSRKENADGEIESSFSLRLKIQEKNEEDPSDIRYKAFSDWFKSKQKTQSTTSTGPRRKK